MRSGSTDAGKITCDSDVPGGAAVMSRCVLCWMLALIVQVLICPGIA